MKEYGIGLYLGLQSSWYIKEGLNWVGQIIYSRRIISQETKIRQIPRQDDDVHGDWWCDEPSAFEEYFEHMRNPEKCVSIGKALVSKSSFSSKNA